MMKINIVWLRRDLRLEDNTALDYALSSELPLLPVFIFDNNITDDLPSGDPRISFIHSSLFSINETLTKYGSSLLILKGKPEDAWNRIISTFEVDTVFVNQDYEPYAIERDKRIKKIIELKGIKFRSYKDQVIFEEKEIIKSDNTPYTVFTPYRNRWKMMYDIRQPGINGRLLKKEMNFIKRKFPFPALEDIGFLKSPVKVKPYDLSVIPEYHRYRDLPAADLTSYLSPHLRFGTVSIRKLVTIAGEQNTAFLNELIWREFFMQILNNFPGVISDNFRKQYDDINWRNDDKEFTRWCRGETGYPIVDAGMHQLNETGYMHNRVRMITAGFLCKHLLIDWKWGEAYFAGKLLDYELSSNNGNWQWAAGTGCDAAPYFRIFNPDIQQKKFDKNNEYITKWAGRPDSSGYGSKIVDHEFARLRAIATYREGLRRLNRKSHN